MSETSDRHLPARCPSCRGEMAVVRLECTACGTSIEGQFLPCSVCRLDHDLRDLFEQFLDARGNLKDIQRTLGVSYPTVRARIDKMFQQLGRSSSVELTPREVLRRLSAGEITVDEAEQMLRRAE